MKRLAPVLLLLSAAALAAEPLAADVPKKSRGFSLETSTVTGGAVLRPKDRVDVIAVVTDPETAKQGTVLLLQNVVVLGNAAPVPGEPRQLTLLLIPDEALLLAAAHQNGHLVATLRNADDAHTLEGQTPVTVKNVIAGEPPRFLLKPTAKR
ncbi:MAG: RcpC/CpaB family pilus assembly protein [Myxococcales bacterium]|nr:RcpC/CpaB family pilus assembly protein [Myxococcales bacterium]